MKPDARFVAQPKSFWANVRAIGQHAGYANKGKAKPSTLYEIQPAFNNAGLSHNMIMDKDRIPTELGKSLVEYFKYRAGILNNYVEHYLMDVADASQLFESLFNKLAPKCPLPMNKQKGEMRTPAFFTCIINMIIENALSGYSCDYDPRQLTIITRDGIPVRTFARRVDGAFPSVLNPIAVWEIKEYYYATTFGSRVADGVYESLLDGMEIEELRLNEGIDVKHYLMIDSHRTWWDQGISYLCRIIDMLNMGYVDEVLFGREVIDRLPSLVEEWIKLERERPKIFRISK